MHVQFCLNCQLLRPPSMLTPKQVLPALHHHTVSKCVIASPASPARHLQQLIVRQQLYPIITLARQI